MLDPNYLGDDRDLAAMVSGLRAYVRSTLASYMHPVGTCRIGSDEHAVVDTDLRVHGISGLRVADASVMPSLVSANIYATVYAIAESAAHILTAA